MTKNTLLLRCVVIVLVLCLFSTTVVSASTISYKETTDSFENPERGFYYPLYVELRKSGNKVSQDMNHNLFHLRVDISEFKDSKLTEDALQALNDLFVNIKEHGGTAVVRFAYDKWFNGNADEPDIKLIKTHIRQLSKVINKNEEVVALVEGGMLGQYGEVHSTKACTKENRNAVISTWLKYLNKKITISVRTPMHYTDWLGIDLKQINTSKQKKADMNRIGIYNDGYLGSKSDLGTYSDRDEEIKWVERQTRKTFFGGEMVLYYDNDTRRNTASYMSKEGFKTHTTYLNILWNNNAIADLRKEVYNGTDKLYKGLSGFTYVDNHLGYRYVLKKSNVKVSGKKLTVSFSLKNVGFGNMINDKKATLVLKSKNDIREIPVKFDIRKVLSKKTYTYKTTVEVKDLLDEPYEVYLRISEYGKLKKDKNYNCVRFANKESQYNKEIGANRIGKIS